MTTVRLLHATNDEDRLVDVVDGDVSQLLPATLRQALTTAMRLEAASRQQRDSDNQGMSVVPSVNVFQTRTEAKIGARKLNSRSRSNGCDSDRHDHTAEQRELRTGLEQQNKEVKDKVVTA